MTDSRSPEAVPDAPTTSGVSSVPTDPRPDPDAIEAVSLKLTEYEATQAAAVFNELLKREDPYALTRTVEHILKMRALHPDPRSTDAYARNRLGQRLEDALHANNWAASLSSVHEALELLRGAPTGPSALSDADLMALFRAGMDSPRDTEESIVAAMREWLNGRAP